MNSTNVRFITRHEAAPAAIAFAAWAAFVAILHGTGALETFRDEVPALTLFACGVAALAYGVDAELRRALHAQRVGLLVAAIAAGAAFASLHAAARLALAPAAVVLAAACISRVSGARLRSTVAASPGAKPGAP